MPVRFFNSSTHAAHTVLAAALACGLTVALAGPAAAAPKVSVKTVYYTVHGNTPQAMLSYMQRNGPHGEAGRALGTTSVSTGYKMTLVPVSGGCVIRDYKLEVAITINLPRLAPGQKLSASVRARWNGLAAFVRVHENHHKSVNLKCARRTDQRVRSISRKLSCSAARARVRTIFAEENAKCGRIHDAFDQREAKRIANLPFIRQAAAPEAAPRRTRTRQTRTTRRSIPTPVAGRDLK